MTETPKVLGTFPDGRFTVAVTDRFDDGSLALLVQDMYRDGQTAVYLTRENVETLLSLSVGTDR